MSGERLINTVPIPQKIPDSNAIKSPMLNGTRVSAPVPEPANSISNNPQNPVNIASQRHLLLGSPKKTIAINVAQTGIM